MIITNRTDMRRYVCESTLNYCKNHSYHIDLVKSKPSLTSINGKRYYTDEVMEITLEEKDKKDILAKMTITKGSYGVSLYDVVKAIFGPNAEQEYAYVDCEWTIVWEFGKKGFGYTRYSMDTEVKTPTFTFYLAKLSTLKEVPLTKREQEKKKLIAEKEARRKMNAVTVKDTMIQILNENEYDLYGTDHGISFRGIKGYNKLMKDALEYYLNNKIFKDMNVEISIPKVNNRHKYGFNDALFYFGDVIVKE